MLVLVVLVVDMLVFVLQRFVLVFMFVTLRQMQPDADGHQRPSDNKRQSDFFPKQQSQQRTEKGRNREIGPGARGAKVTQRHHEQRQAHSVREQANQHRGDATRP